MAGAPAAQPSPEVVMLGSVLSSAARLDVEYAHEAQTEAVDVVLCDPVADAFDHILAHELTFAGCLVAAA